MAATAQLLPFAFTPVSETKRQRYERLLTALKNDRDTNFRSHWEDIGRHLLPRRVRWNNSSDRNKGDKVNKHIVDATGTLALRTLRSGMMTGVTSPARPWFRLTTPDPDLAEYGPVKDWLHTVTTRMREVFLRSNFYKMLPGIYRDIGGFGTAAGLLLEDAQDVLRGYGFPLGSYVLATSNRSVVDTLIREYTMTVRQLVMEFGDPQASPANRWAPFSQTVRNAWDQGSYEQLIEVVHVVTPNAWRDPNRARAKYKPIASCHYERASHEYAGDENRFLRESGFDENPILGPRWDLASPDDVYGGECPGMDALGDVRALQLLQKRKAEAIEKMVRPPMKGPTRLRNQKVSILPGDITYDDQLQGGGDLKPIFEVKPDITGLIEDIREHQERIRRVFYEDLFLMLAMTDRRQITAREVAERHEEKLLMLGPVLEHLNDELLNPAIDRTFALMLKRDMIPTPPDELQGVNLKVEYISIMHQAQKMVAAGAMDQFLDRVGTIAITQSKAGQHPEALDKIDTDQAIDEYAEIYGVPPRIVVPDEQVAKLRKARAERAAQAQAAAQAEQAAGAAKQLSDTDTEGKNALTDILALAGQGAA